MGEVGPVGLDLCVSLTMDSLFIPRLVFCVYFSSAGQNSVCVDVCVCLDINQGGTNRHPWHTEDL